MFGSREPFTYLDCADCGSLSIAAVPANLGDHYPPTYYSFARELKPRFGYLARRLAMRALISLPGSLHARLPAAYSRWRGMAKAKVNLSTRILDVGCGNGALLKALERSGFKNLHGVDPFIDRSVSSPHITITKGELGDLRGEYRFILLSHSLEHMPDPRAALREVARICSPGGHALIALPVVNRSWRDLGPDWIALDPPRHLFIPTVSGLTALVDSIPGLSLRDVWFDTGTLEFYGSHLARKRVPLRDPGGRGDTNAHAYFDKAQFAAWQRDAREYNKRGDAGTASFLIQKN